MNLFLGHWECWLSFLSSHFKKPQLILMLDAGDSGTNLYFGSALMCAGRLAYEKHWHVLEKSIVDNVSRLGSYRNIVGSCQMPKTKITAKKWGALGTNIAQHHLVFQEGPPGWDLSSLEVHICSATPPQSFRTQVDHNLSVSSLEFPIGA